MQLLLMTLLLIIVEYNSYPTPEVWFVACIHILDRQTDKVSIKNSVLWALNRSLAR